MTVSLKVISEKQCYAVIKYIVINNCIPNHVIAALMFAIKAYRICVPFLENTNFSNIRNMNFANV